MHAEVEQFLRRCEPHFPGKEVLDIGAFDINGSARSILASINRGYEVTGIDWRPGPGVDVVSLAHEYDPGEQLFDAVTCLEVLEHDPHWKQTVAAAARLLRTGGALVMTWASGRRSAHETDASPVPGYYRNLSCDEVADVLTPLLALGWFEEGRSGQDAYMMGIK